MAVWSWDGVIPVVAVSAFVHPEAVLIGDVIVGAGCYIGAGAVLRGDFGRIILEPGSNVQETCVAHAFPGKDVLIEERGHVGHGAVLHGCRIGRNALIGMNSVVMDEARIGENSILGAMAFVRAGTDIPANVMAVGAPVRILRALSEQEIDWKSRGTDVYRQLAVDAPTRLAPAQPLAEVEAGRRRVSAPRYDPLVVERATLSEQP